MAASAGISAGTYPRGGLYYAGGFVGQDVADTYESFFDSGLRQSAFTLRGYASRQFSGSEYNLFNAEYRFPISYVDRGVSTLPVYMTTISGALFADYGGAFHRIDLRRPLESYHLGVGAELWVNLVLNYRTRGTIRIGHARGTDSAAAAGGQTYIVVASAF